MPSSPRALPALRGALLADADGVVLEVDRSPEAVAFASSARAPEVSQVGAPCPDHLINTKHKPLVVRVRPRARTAPTSSPRRSGRGVDEYAAWYREYYERNLDDETRPVPDRPGRAARRARPRRRHRHERRRTRRGRGSPATSTTARSPCRTPRTPLGGFRSLSESEAFAIEYWPLERYKLAQAPPRGELAGTGRAHHRRRQRDRPRDRPPARRARRARRRRRPERRRRAGGRGRARRGPRRSAAALAVARRRDRRGRPSCEMTRRAVLAYGGLDILVASAGLATSAPITETTLDEWELNYAVLARGYFLAAREAFRVLLEQGRGGSVVFVGSKNALVAGANAAAYSSAKAASLHLARCLAEEGGPHGIRVNTVNPDAVIQGSSIWSSDWKAERASTYGVDRGRAADLLPRPHEARGQRLPRGRRRGDRVLRRPALGEVDRQRHQRRRRRHGRVPAMSDAPTAAAASSFAAISKSYGGVQALADVSFAIQAGTVHALVGENGAGKSTLVKILTGVVQPDDGEMLIDGEPRLDRRPADRAQARASSRCTRSRRSSRT